MKMTAVWMVCALVATTGCRFEHRDRTGSKDGDVKFATPFGGMSVKTDEKSAQAGVGLTPYPGAVLATKESGKEDGAADVNLNFGSFHLGVKALNYQSGDAPDKVMAFYRKDMAKFGSVVQCHGHTPIGQPTQTQDGLSCNIDGGGKTININGGDSEDQLRAGSRQHQHIVSIEPKNGGTKIGLVMLDLPGNVGDDAKD